MDITTQESQGTSRTHTGTEQTPMANALYIKSCCRGVQTFGKLARPREWRSTDKGTLMGLSGCTEGPAQPLHRHAS